jgi:hypothetical protein
LIYLNLDRECCQFNKTYLTEEKPSDAREETARDSGGDLLEATSKVAIVVQYGFTCRVEVILEPRYHVSFIVIAHYFFLLT